MSATHHRAALVLQHRRVGSTLCFWPGQRRQQWAGSILLVLAAGLAALIVLWALDRRGDPGNGTERMVWAILLVACVISLRFGLWLIARKRVLVLDPARAMCTVELRGVAPPWPVRETPPAHLSLLDVTQFVVVSRPVIDRFAPHGRLWHGVAVETRDSLRHDLGWDFLDEAQTAAAVVEELNRALADCSGGNRATRSRL